MPDRFASTSNLTNPAVDAVPIVPSDVADLVDPPKGIYVGTGGDLAVIGLAAPVGASAVVWKNVPAGALIPFRPRRVLATGTTAASLLALY